MNAPVPSQKLSECHATVASAPAEKENKIQTFTFQPCHIFFLHSLYQHDLVHYPGYLR